MIKKRLIFTLLYESGFFVQSRNFNLQKVGNSKWINDNYNFHHNIHLYIHIGLNHSLYDNYPQNKKDN